jgi:ATP-dependent phosphoenolpyruvate carboxykinase
VADPYAARTDDGDPIGERPAGDAGLAALVGTCGGAGLGDLEAAAGLDAAAGLRCVAVLVADDGPLPPIARLTAPLAVVLLIAPGDSAATAHAAAARLESVGAPLLLLKRGLVAGPAGRAGAFEIEPALRELLLVAAIEERIVWERDPDFGYDVAAEVPGVEGAAADALCPRLLYAGADRVYEHADLVVDYKRRRYERVALIGAEGSLLRASGWPVEPTGQSWKD